MDACVQIAFLKQQKDVRALTSSRAPKLVILNLVILINSVESNFVVEMMKARRKIFKVKFEPEGFLLKVALIIIFCFY